MADRTRARELAAEFIQKGDPTGWFEVLYREAEEGKSVVPWADRSGNPLLIDFWRKNPQPTEGKLALSVGSGLGDDAEQLAAWGFETTAFDISETAVRACRKRFPSSVVHYVVADVLNPPQDWNGKFDFVFEANTIQTLKGAIRQDAIQKIAQFVRPGGMLLVVARGRDESDSEGAMPWPLIRPEFDGFIHAGMTEVSFDDFFDSEDPPTRRFRVVYQR